MRSVHSSRARMIRSRQRATYRITCTGIGSRGCALSCSSISSSARARVCRSSRCRLCDYWPPRHIRHTNSSYSIYRFEAGADGRLPWRPMNTNVVDFVRGASSEISTHDEDLLPTLAGKLPGGMVMYVAHTPKASVEDV